MIGNQAHRGYVGLGRGTGKQISHTAALHKQEESMHVVAIGGGGGATQVLRAVAAWATRRTALIAVTDTGRSTGLARQIGGIPAPGDLRATIAAFAQTLARLLDHRFDGAGVPALNGMALGNLLLAGLSRELGSFDAAVTYLQHLAQSSVNVLPISTADTQLCATLADGQRVTGELAVRGPGKPPIAELFLHPAAPATPAALAAIHAADLVVLGPGSLFTTICADLSFQGVAAALRETQATVVYIVNTTTQPGQTDGLSASDHVAQIVRTLGAGTLDAAVINASTPTTAQLARLAAEGLELLAVNPATIAAVAALGVRPVVADLTEQTADERALWNKQDTIRHDPARLGVALNALAEARKA
jgi:uncharacterized cofD-like protein